MKPYVSQPKGSMCCGAYSIAYYLWENNKDTHINDRTFVDSIYERIQLGFNTVGISEVCSSPQKIAMELSDNWKSPSFLCGLPNSYLGSFAEKLNMSWLDMDVMDKVKSGDNKYAIILCGYENDGLALHYILIKYEDDTFKMLNSSAIYGDGVDNVNWEEFIVEANRKITLSRYTPYIYTGAGILID
ncbi:hypothetical protein [Clostridium manihotivorum]|uniref:Peptidase C39-like domain-containing protein n=1 Tax=Clostridium manihotivorum TaxID=2320868 RepID=A0A3R5UFA4_9CLOT|nr:hypothetical protein [Clostridium manihotivorum]QAA32150.1 hypothetical protein C1I91_11075 [Clostridium manihotivorum]